MEFIGVHCSQRLRQGGIKFFASWEDLFWAKDFAWNNVIFDKSHPLNSFSLFTYHRDSQQEMLGCGKTGYPLHDLYTPQIIQDTSFLYELTQ